MLTKIASLRAASAQAGAGTVTGTEANGGLIKFDQDFDYLAVQLIVSAAATDTGDTLDVYIDTSFDGGTTWLNIGHFTQVLGDGGAKTFIMGFATSPVASSNCVPVGTNQSAGNALQIGMGDRIRYRGVVADVSTEDASFTYSVTAYLEE